MYVVLSGDYDGDGHGSGWTGTVTDGRKGKDAGKTTEVVTGAASGWVALDGRAGLGMSVGGRCGLFSQGPDGFAVGMPTVYMRVAGQSSPLLPPENTPRQGSCCCPDWPGMLDVSAIPPNTAASCALRTPVPLSLVTTTPPGSFPFSRSWNERYTLSRLLAPTTRHSSSVFPRRRAPSWPPNSASPSSWPHLRPWTLAARSPSSHLTWPELAPRRLHVAQPACWRREVTPSTWKQAEEAAAGLGKMLQPVCLLPPSSPGFLSFFSRNQLCVQSLRSCLVQRSMTVLRLLKSQQDDVCFALDETRIVKPRAVCFQCCLELAPSLHLRRRRPSPALTIIKVPPSFQTPSARRENASAVAVNVAWPSAPSIPRP
ncbi:hypothetical protein CSOJ01_05287 [Colletotrichum sojae]|uniref:Uncharacterized protein n=1 Tax=Colletotrichum sojae TaxID=2175907 RepID=A0A8H6MXT0_9PEZI|nr:hypothetical protein CSOJ01_05287 [Colletotrichum sojae]